MDVFIDNEDEDVAQEPEHEAESRFYTCHVCGDNWLSVRETGGADSKVTFVHQMGMSPELKRIAHLESHLVLNSDTVDHWEYFLDDELVDESVWQEKLENRRRILKSICSN